MIQRYFLKCGVAERRWHRHRKPGWLGRLSRITSIPLITISSFKKSWLKVKNIKMSLHNRWESSTLSTKISLIFHSFSKSFFHQRSSLVTRWRHLTSEGKCQRHLTAAAGAVCDQQPSHPHSHFHTGPSCTPVAPHSSARPTQHYPTCTAYHVLVRTQHILYSVRTRKWRLTRSL